MSVASVMSAARVRSQPGVARELPTSVRPLAWIACSTGMGVLVCSLADALSRATEAPPSLIFWEGILVLVLPVFVRLTAAEPSARERLALVCVLGLALYGVKLLRDPFVFTYSDELAHQYNAEQIVRDHQLFTHNPLLAVTASYPGLEGATSALMTLTGLSAFGAGILVVGAGRLTLVAGLFFLFTRISGSARIGALGAAVYTANSNFLFYNAQFSYESLALPLFVVVLAMLAERATQARSLRHVWVGPVVLVMAAIVVTHHVTSYALVIALVGLAGVTAAMRGRSRTANPWPFAVVAALLTAFWLVVVATVTATYLRPVFEHAFTGALATASGASKAREPFSGAGGAPLGERIVAFASVALLAGSLPFGLWQVWRRHRLQPMAWLFSAAAVLLFATFPLRLSPEAWETAGRAAEFLFIGLAFVVACLCERVLTTGRAPILSRAVLTGCFGIVCIGGIIYGWPANVRLSQPLRVAADGRVVESERFALAHWAARHLPGQRFIAVGMDAGLLINHGRAGTAVNGTYPDFQDVIQSPNLAAWELALVRQHRVRYVVSDRQVTPSLFFSVRGVRERRLPESTMRKFEGVRAAPVFSSGDIIVYDLNGRP